MMRFVMYVLLYAASMLPLCLCAQFSNIQLTSLGVQGIFGSYAIFSFNMVDPSTSVNNSVTCQYAWYAPGMVNSSEIPADSNISWNSSTLNENYMPCVLESPQSVTIVDKLFEFYIQNFVNFDNFAIQVHHAFLDKAVGPCAVESDGTPFYCDTNLFAQANITPANVTCASGSNSYVECTLPQGSNATIPVYEIVA